MNKDDILVVLYFCCFPLALVAITYEQYILACTIIILLVVAAAFFDRE